MNIKTKTLIIFILSLIIPQGLSAKYIDTLDINYGLPKYRTEARHPAAKAGLALLEGQIYNISFLHFDKYILKADYAQVTIPSIKKNLKFGTGWDHDAVAINMIGHPVQGAADHIINRLNGVSFWGSLPLTFINSTTWELFCETEPPSINDFFTTAWNGVTLGEAMWRIGNYTLYKNARKGVDFTLRAGLGTRTVTELCHSIPHPKNSPAAGVGASATLDIVYGDRMHVKNNAPMNFFDIHLTAAVGTGQTPISEFTMLGRLWGLELSPKKGEALFGIFDHMSTFLSEIWIKNPTSETLSPYRCSEACSIGPGIFYSNKGFTTGAFVAATVVGAGTTDHYNIYDRDYNFGSGYSIKSLNTYKASDLFTICLNLRHYQLFTFWGDRPIDVPDKHYINSMGNNGTTLTEVANFKLICSPHKNIDIELSTFFIHRNSFYDLYPKASASHMTAELGIRYCLSKK